MFLEYKLYIRYYKLDIFVLDLLTMFNGNSSTDFTNPCSPNNFKKMMI